MTSSTTQWSPARRLYLRTGGLVPLEPQTALTHQRELMLLSIRGSADLLPLTQDIVDTLAIEIVEGTIHPGDEVNSVELARRFNTSRTPVRQALTELERQGVVVLPARKRPYVAMVTLKQVRDLYLIRTSLSELVSKLIVDECPQEEIAKLWPWQHALEADTAAEAADAYFWHNVGFRLVELHLAPNPDLHRLTSSLGLRTLQLRHLSLSLPGRLSRSVELHRQLLEAYERRDKETAVASTQELIMNGYRAIERSGLVPDAVPGTPEPENTSPGP